MANDLSEGLARIQVLMPLSGDTTYIKTENMVQKWSIINESIPFVLKLVDTLRSVLHGESQIVCPHE